MLYSVFLLFFVVFYTVTFLSLSRYCCCHYNDVWQSAVDVVTVS